MRRITYLLLFVFFSQQLIGNLNDYTFEQINSSTGITFNAINNLAEDKYGFIWFCCSNGLYYYNSAEIQKFDFEKSKSDPFVMDETRFIYKDRFEKLWILTRRDIAYFNEEENRFHRVNFTNENSEVVLNHPMNLLQLKDETYLVQISGSIYSFTLSDLTLKRIPVSESNIHITHFTIDDNDNIYVSTTNKSIFKGNLQQAEFENIYQLKHEGVETLAHIEDRLWVGYKNHGLEVLTEQGSYSSSYTQNLRGENYINSNTIRTIIEGPDHEVWVGTFEGVSIITDDGTYNIADNPKNGLPHQGVFDLFRDKNDGIWAATWSGGLAYHNKYNYKFPHITGKETKEMAWNTVVSGFSEDKSGTIWVGSENHGLNKYSLSKGLQKVTNFPISRIKSLYTDQKGRLWISTLFEGLWMYNGREIKRIGKIEGIFSTVFATNDGVWIGTKGDGAILYNEKENLFAHYKHDENVEGSICANSVWQILKDSKENIWFCTDNGISVKLKGEDSFKTFMSGSSELSTNTNYTMVEDKQGKIWLGTAGKGIDIYNPKTKTFSKFAYNKEIENTEVYCILKDHDDNIWFSSSQGIYAYYHVTKSLKHFTKEDGLQGQQYHPNSGFVDSKGILYFGGGNGFNVIDPSAVHPNTLSHELYLSNLRINNQTIDINQPKFINSSYLPTVNEIELNHKQNSITVAFVANSYIKNSKSKFKYRLLNYMDEWSETDYNSNISFIKVPPGKYKLQIDYLNNDGLSNAALKEIDIDIDHPFWLKWYAFVLYIVLIEVIVMLTFREMRFRAKSKVDQTLFSEKVKFFTNVSHEFRTPLTLIISPINTLMRRFINEPQTLESLRIVERNADRLLRLTNQILDFRLIEIDNVKLKRKEVDLISICKNVYDCFEFQIKEKEINCIFKSSFKTFNMHLDPEKIEKVIYNILSNALKYSNEKGQIIVSIEQNTLVKDNYTNVFTTGHNLTGEVLEIKIKDNGKGIDKNILNSIFDRFFVDHSDNETGTGIGLHICQEYIKMHNGNIMVESEKNSETTFTINLPIDSEVSYENEELILQSFFDPSTEQKTNEENSSTSASKPLVLFAEDNNELRKYYKNLLSNRYKVITAKNGTQAFEIANELSPNLIISDILMPGMDGMSLTEQIRNTEKIKHIPIILLTALSDNKFKVESMHKGANAFLTKPVDEEFLFAKIENIFNNTLAMKNHYKDSDANSYASADNADSFIDKVEKIVEKNLQNQAFEITELATQVGISRSSLQRKIKKMVNMSPSEFIREVRLKKAINLLKKDQYNIDEIAIMVGFNSTSYFIRSFKKKYEMTPTAYKQSLMK